MGIFNKDKWKTIDSCPIGKIVMLACDTYDCGWTYDFCWSNKGACIPAWRYRIIQEPKEEKIPSILKWAYSPDENQPKERKERIVGEPKKRSLKEFFEDDFDLMPSELRYCMRKLCRYIDASNHKR